MKKFLGLMLTVLMLAAALSVPAHAATIKDYASAANGELLYVLDFRGDDVYAPVALECDQKELTGAKYTPSADGKSIHVEGVKGVHNSIKKTYGSAIKGLKADKTTVYTLFYKIRMNGTAGKNNSIAVGGYCYYAPAQLGAGEV